VFHKKKWNAKITFWQKTNHYFVNGIHLISATFFDGYPNNNATGGLRVNFQIADQYFFPFQISVLVSDIYLLTGQEFY